MTNSVVYVVSNPAMPGLVKIGRTGQDEVEIRIRQLYSTGVPFPFKVEFACSVPNPEEVEKALHTAFAPQRVNSSREFFQIEPNQAIAILKLLHVEDSTTAVKAQLANDDQADSAAGEEFIKRRPNLNFQEMGIAIGDEIQCAAAQKSALVVGPKKVKLDGEELSLTAATRTLLQLEYNVQPGPYWTYKGRSLRSIYNETYPAAD